ncbi:MAG: hypothetical protein KGH99_03270 [Thaumarchaeota archaeon]|nr:hypothetical protein [Nitrososphaerota archaeon]MDE1872481.1 hypothetical protein [Nitrososphaerota archaeon]
MADFNFLEHLAAQIKANRKQLTNVEDELATINFRIHEIPLKISTESNFAKMIGEQYNDATKDLESAKEKLMGEKETLSTKINEDISTFIAEFTSQELVIPLESNPKIADGNTLFKYKGGSTFRNIFDILGELLGLSSPILVKDVMFSPTEIIIKVTDEYEAKQKFLSSINEVQKTLSIKRRKT